MTSDTDGPTATDLLRHCIPTVHINGTSARELINQLRSAVEALHLAEHAVNGAQPHGRDFYVRGPTAFTLAQLAHAERLATLAHMRRDLQTIAIAIMDQTNTEPPQ